MHEALSASLCQKGILWPSQAMKLPDFSIVVPSMMPSSCSTARSLLNSFSGFTFCKAQQSNPQTEPCRSESS